jgi:hypothetical protein
VERLAPESPSGWRHTIGWSISVPVDRPDSKSPANRLAKAASRAERRPVREDLARTETEAFYDAQEQGFAAIRARNQTRARRKI